MKKTKELKLIIIENFIDHITIDIVERNRMKVVAIQYVEEDHVDEIKQSFPKSVDVNELLSRTKA